MLVVTSQEQELVVGEGEAVLLAGKGLPDDGVHLHVVQVEAGDHIGLHW